MPTVMNPDVKPVGDNRSHRHRLSRLSLLQGTLAYDYFKASPFFTPEATKDTMEGTQFGDENHRRITPYVQDLYERQMILGRLDRVVANVTFSAIGDPTKYDVAIIGSGPHGAAVAAYLREKRPDVRTIIIEGGDKLGGQWRSYGPKPVFQMNSRVRKADRRLPALPRTPGSINPLGKFAPLELSDIATGSYPWNTDMGNVCAINSFLSATDVVVGCRVTRVDEKFDELSNAYRLLRLETPYGERLVSAKFTVDATGLVSSGSRVAVFGDDPPDGYFTMKSFYEHFATDKNPLERFHEAKVAVIGRGDSALTVLEALVGNLPRETYGLSGVGRMRPRRIDWIGAPSRFVNEIEPCLRTRYKNGIVQSLRREETDECGVIVPDGDLVSYVRRGSDAYFDLETTNAKLSFPNVVVDCTNQAGRQKTRAIGWNPNYFVGPSNGSAFSDRTARKIRDLGIAENNVSLWATMEYSDQVADALCQSL